jgi:protein SCO1/2
MHICLVILTIAVVAGAPAGNADPLPELALGRTVLHDYDPPTPGSYDLPAIKPAADGAILGEDGKARRLREMFAGRISVLGFIYTRCTDPRACPYATRVLYQLHQVSSQDPLLASNMHLITMSFDPAHDTPEVMTKFKDRYEPERPGAKWSYLTTRGAEDIRAILDAYGQAVDRKKNPNAESGPFHHQLRVYLIDRQDMIRNIYSYDLLDPRLVITDIRTLLLEEQARTNGVAALHRPEIAP